MEDPIAVIIALLWPEAVDLSNGFGRYPKRGERSSFLRHEIQPGCVEGAL